MLRKNESTCLNPGGCSDRIRARFTSLAGSCAYHGMGVHADEQRQQKGFAMNRPDRADRSVSIGGDATRTVICTGDLFLTMLQHGAQINAAIQPQPQPVPLKLPVNIPAPKCNLVDRQVERETVLAR